MAGAQHPALARCGALPERLTPDATTVPNQRNSDQKMDGGTGRLQFWPEKPPH